MDNCFTHHEYVDLIGSKFSGEWLDLPLLLPYPSLNYGLCAATNPNAVAFEPSGLLQRCLQLTGDVQAATGHVDTGRDHQKEDVWYCLDPLSRTQCRECRYLPHCFGGCRRQWLAQGRPECSMFKRDLDSWLIRRYEREQRRKAARTLPDRRSAQT